MVWSIGCLSVLICFNWSIRVCDGFDCDSLFLAIYCSGICAFLFTYWVSSSAFIWAIVWLFSFRELVKMLFIMIIILAVKILREISLPAFLLLKLSKTLWFIESFEIIIKISTKTLMLKSSELLLLKPIRSSVKISFKSLAHLMPSIISLFIVMILSLSIFMLKRYLALWNIDITLSSGSTLQKSITTLTLPSTILEAMPTYSYSVLKIFLRCPRLETPSSIMSPLTTSKAWFRPF